MHLAHMMQGPLAGSGYDGGPTINDSEIRAELSIEQIAALNEAIYQ